jgi:hypothetical protein
MTKLMHKVITDFNKDNLAVEHNKTQKEVLSQIKNDCFFKIIKNSELDELLPELFVSEQATLKFIEFLKVQFNGSVIQYH